MMKPLGAALAVLGLAGAASAAAPARPPLASVSHIAIYAADMARSEAFYVHDLGGVKMADPEDARGVRYYFSPTQFVEVLPLPSGWTSLLRLVHVAINTPDAEAMRAYLAAQKVKVPAHVEHGGDGSRWFDVADPEGTIVRFVQPPASLPAIPVNALSSHMMHFGFIVHDRAREDGFWQRILGLHPYRAGGMEDDKPTWISLQLPTGATGSNT
jgi:catechol 2,3-dioxygenase-like lactoylglutathione lyase family enzyme